MIDALEVGEAAVGYHKLGLKKSITLHSISSGGAMAMYLEGCPVYTIMKVRETVYSKTTFAPLSQNRCFHTFSTVI